MPSIIHLHWNGLSVSFYKWIFILSLKFEERFLIYDSSTSIGDWRTMVILFLCLMSLLGCSKILLTSIKIETTSYWHHVNRSDVGSTYIMSIWCRFDPEFTPFFRLFTSTSVTTPSSTSIYAATTTAVNKGHGCDHMLFETRSFQGYRVIDNTMNLHFHSDFCIVRNGFTVEYSQAPGMCLVISF